MLIETEQFKGPLAVLLKMIEEEKMDITEVSLLKIADQYIEYIKSSTTISPNNIADFLVIASKLLLIKSKALLPYLSQEEEEEIIEFEKQLKMYQEFLQATKTIQSLLGKKRFMFAREFDRKALLNSQKIFLPPQIKLAELPLIFQEVLNRIQPAESLEEVEIQDDINIEDKIAYITDFLENKIKLIFSQLIKNTKSKTEAIVNFLAILELAKQEKIIINQGELFGEIEIEKYG